MPADRELGAPHVLRAAARPRTAQRRARADAQGRACTPPSTTCRCTPPTRGRRFAARQTDCPVSEDVSGRLLRLPFHNNLSDPTSTAWWPRSSRPRTATLPASGPSPGQPGSSSLRQPGYWWHRARTDLLAAVMAPYLGDPEPHARRRQRGRASVGWMRGDHQHVTLDLFPDGLRPGRGRRAARPPRCPSRTGPSTSSAPSTWSSTARTTRWRVSELARVLAPGGRMLLSVPGLPVGVVRPRRPGRSPPALHAAQARRAGRGRRAGGRAVDVRLRRGVPALRGRARCAAGCVAPATGDASLLPRSRRALDRVLMGLSGLDARAAAPPDLPFGSSVFLAAVKPSSAPALARDDAPPRGAPGAATSADHERRRRPFDREQPVVGQRSATAPARTATPHAPATAARAVQASATTISTRLTSATAHPAARSAASPRRARSRPCRRRPRARPGRTAAPTTPPSVHDRRPQHEAPARRRGPALARHDAPGDVARELGQRAQPTMYGARNRASVANTAVISAGEPPISASTTAPPVSTPCASSCAVAAPPRNASEPPRPEPASSKRQAPGHSAINDPATRHRP